MKRLIPYFSLSVLVILGYTLVFIYFDGQNVKELEFSFNEQQAVHVNLAARAIEDRYDWQLTILNSLANILMAGDTLDANWQEILDLFESPDAPYTKYTFIGLVDATGRIQHITAFAPEQNSTAFVFLQDHIPDALENESVYVTPLYATPDKQFYAIIYPLMQDDSLNGYLALGIDFHQILERHIIPIRAGQYGAAWIQDENGTVIYDHENKIIGQNVYDLHANYPSLLSFDHLYLEVPSGTGEYTFTVQRDGLIRRKLLAWNTAQLGNQQLTIAMSAPDGEIGSQVSETRRSVLIGGFALLVFLVVGGIWTFSTQQRQLQTLVDERTRELQKERQALQEQERILRLSLDAAHAGVWVWDLTSQKIIWDETTAAIHGTTIQEFNGLYDTWRVMVHPDDITRVEASVNAALAGQIQFDEEFRIIFPDETIHYMLGQGIVLYDEQGSPAQMIGINIDITNRKQAENALQESKALYQSLVDSLPMHIYRIDLEGRLTFVNRVLLNNLGLAEADVLGKTAYNFYPDELAKKYRADDAIVLQQHEILHTTEKNIDWQTNTTRYVEVIKIPIYDEVENPVGLQGAFWDVTERIETAQQLENYSRQLESLHEIANILSSTLNLEEVLQLFLKELEKLVPYSSASIFLDDGETISFMAGRYLPDYGGKLDLAKAVDDSPFYNQIKKTGKAIRLPDVQQDPNWAVFDEDLPIRSWMGIPLTFKGQFLGLLGLDHTETGAFDEEQMRIALAVAHQAALAIENAQLYADLEKRVERRTRKLRESEAKERALLEAIPDVVFRLRRDGTILDCRVHPHKGFYIDPDEIIGKLLQNVFTPKTAMVTLANIEMTLDAQVMQTYTFQRTVPGGSNTFFEARMVASGENEVVVLVRDVSQEQALQEQRDRFIANAAHELKTPLTIIMTRIYLMRRKPEKMAEHLAILDEVSKTMKSLVDGLLDIARFESGMLQLNKTMCRLDEIVLSVVNQLSTNAEKKDLELAIETPQNIDPLYLDALRISQVITNIVVNAINYTDEGQVKVTLGQQDQQAIITIQDTGTGIPPEYLPDEIFLPFNRAHRQSTIKGTGLGLTIAKEVVELHGGTISVVSNMGEGTTFTIQLPMEESAPPTGG